MKRFDTFPPRTRHPKQLSQRVNRRRALQFEDLEARSLLSITDLSGTWTGTSSGPNLAVTSSWHMTLDVTQTDSQIQGTRRVNPPDTPYFVLYEVSGVVSDSSFTYTDVAVLDHNLPPNVSVIYITNAQLTISAAGSHLAGPWTATNDSRGFGQITLERDMVTTPEDIGVISAQLDSSQRLINFGYEFAGDPGRPFAVSVYSSADTMFDSGDVPFLIATQQITPTPNASGQGSFTLSAPLTTDPTRPNILVVADPANTVPESNEGNNVAPLVVIAAPDLVATSFNYSITTKLGLQINTLLPVGSEFTVNLELKNQGAGDSGSFDVVLYVSADQKIDIGFDFTSLSLKLPRVSGLRAGESRMITATATLPLLLSPTVYHGRVWLGVAVDTDNQVPESNDVNNWNRAGNTTLGDIRPVQLFDPFVVPKVTTGTDPRFDLGSSSRQAARWLEQNKFKKISFPFDNFRSFSRRSSDITVSYFNGIALPGKFYRIEGVLRRSNGRYRLRTISGADSTFPPSDVKSILLTEPNPEAVLRPDWRKELGGLNAWIQWVRYVYSWHRNS